ncbi:hypothetical protein F2P81_006293 [Scophthalmus maximus]|uniref:DUF4537 domain-containing protein n=1 Tax=Scophthalmus maximus TaxID=52904 RepID=A0A6A4T5I1_SCOMX|nr:hypothetical protein F2P81_006293 [Scophthalmus maximus]
MKEADSVLSTSPWKPTSTVGGTLSSAADSGHHKQECYSIRMTSGQMGQSEAALVPLFLGKVSCNTTFVLDCSEGTRSVLGSVKRLLIQTLLTKASRRDSLFNIMTFSNTVNAWSHHMLPCAPDTVYTALSWIHSISCSAGRDLLAALSLALIDPACHAVHLLAADQPDQPGAVLSALPALAAGRPVNTFYLQDSDGQPDINTRDYLRRLTQATRGSCYVVVDSSDGKLGKHNTCTPPLRSVPMVDWIVHSDIMSYIHTVHFVLGVTDLYWGRTGVYVVEFDHPGGAGLGVVSPQRQLVCSPDMVNHSIRHQAHRLVPGDSVLSPWQPNLRRYGPGRVMANAERGGCFGANGVTSVRVLMWNGCVSLLPDRLVLPLSASHHERIVRELPVPTSAQSHSCSWLCARSSSWTPQLFCTDCSASTSRCCAVINRRPCAVPAGCGSSLGGVDGSERAEGDEQVDFGKRDLEVPFSSSSSFTEDESTATFPPAGKPRGKQPHRPPWRYWRRTGPEPQHRQPALCFSHFQVLKKEERALEKFWVGPTSDLDRLRDGSLLHGTMPLLFTHNVSVYRLLNFAMSVKNK